MATFSTELFSFVRKKIWTGSQARDTASRCVKRQVTFHSVFLESIRSNREALAKNVRAIQKFEAKRVVGEASCEERVLSSRFKKSLLKHATQMHAFHPSQGGSDTMNIEVCSHRDSLASVLLVCDIFSRVISI